MTARPPSTPHPDEALTDYVICLARFVLPPEDAMHLVVKHETASYFHSDWAFVVL
jgi:hypothetical protein